MACRAILFLALLTGSGAVQNEDFYDFGELVGDARLQLGTDDVAGVNLTTPVAFYDQLYSRVWISDNGYIRFTEPGSSAYRQEKLPLNFPAIAVFLGNTDTSWQGFISYREVATTALVDRATNEVREHFSQAIHFRPRTVLVITWEYVGRFGENRAEDGNNYQIIIMSDGRETYLAFYYLDNQVSWLRSQDSDPYAEAGFDSGDGQNFFRLPGSGVSEVQASFVSGSNAGVRGMWLYQIGRVRQPIGPDTSNEAVPVPDITRPDEGSTDGGLSSTSCSSGATGCHTNARCVDYPAGFCCECKEPNYGNGKLCLEPGQPQRINGKMGGTVNGVTFDNCDLHSYVVAAEGRAYTAISKTPPELGPQLQILFQTSDVISWLFALSQAPAKNGLSLTGGTFNRSLIMRFDSGQVLNVRQEVPGPDVDGYLRMMIVLTGEVPNVPADARINVDEFNYEYIRKQPGVLRSEGSRRYTLQDGDSRQYTYEDTITYVQCPHRPDHDSVNPVNTKVDVARVFVANENNVVRYAMSAKVAPANAVDPCSASVGKCHSVAECIPVDDTFRCECRRGYVGNGLECQDRDECVSGENNCNVNAQCYNTEGSFVCRCLSGYRGDGVRCERDQAPSCADLTCHTNAQCVFDPQYNTPRCECSAGYRGDGLRCEREEERSCGEHQCDSNARCVYDPDIQGPRCECNSGYMGDGVTCRQEISLDRLCAQSRCDTNARCTMNADRVTVRCVCLEGFVGDGYSCRREEISDRDRICNELRCDLNARCEYEPRSNTAQCICNHGYVGDGTTCRARSDENPCDAVRCDVNARCIYDEVNDLARCICASGFSGDGRSCRRQTDEERVCEAQRCDVNARCLYEPITDSAECQCLPGFQGDGRQCLRDGEKLCEGWRCHDQARCVIDQPTGRERCLCNQGYIGNGVTECRFEGGARSCADIRCDPHALCIQDPNLGAVCRCLPGFQGDGYRCQREETQRTCAEVRCDVNARCTDDRSLGPVCICSPGFSGDGYRCQREEPKRTCAELRCDPYAQCEYDAQRGALCRCTQGYVGDGFTCRRGDAGRSCADVRCDSNARCIDDPSQGPVCRCVHGFIGDGYRCQREGGRTCADVQCDVNARCTDDPTMGPFCRCLPGFSGDGSRCLRQVSCNELNNCHPYAECIYDDRARQHVCLCQEGYRGDGVEVCSRDQEPTSDCNVVNNCDVNARCVPDISTNGYSCLCNDGYAGNGYRCRLASCNERNDCHEDATCAYETSSRTYACKCKLGFAGDGKNCREQACNEYNNCHKYAVCTYNQEAAAYRCQCRPEYDGDGKNCHIRVIPCNQVNNCDKNADCTYEETSLNYACRCRAGYRGNGFRCYPSVDCRSDQSLCHKDAACIQAGDQFQCVCRQGYRGDGKICIALSKMINHLIFTQGMSILQVPEHQSDQRKGNMTFMIPGQTAVGITVDCRNLYFYWTDVSGHAIGKARLDGTDSQYILEGLGSPEGVAVDWLAGNIFWTDSVLDRVVVSNTDGTNRKTLVDTNLVNPRGIAVDPSDGKVYWTDWNRAAPKIESCNMDGSDRKVVIDSNLGLPNGLTYDFRRRKLCWSDAGTRRIECSNVDGTERRTVYGLATYPFDLAILGQRVYWTDWEAQNIPNIDIDGGIPNEPLKLPVGGNGKLYGIATIEAECPTGHNACSLGNGGCRFLCLPMPNRGRTCACPDDISEEKCNQLNLIV